MKKLLVKINNDNELMCPGQGYILGIDGFSVCFGKTYTVDEIKNIKEKSNNKEIFVSLNRVIFENELGAYRKILSELDDLNLDGIIVGDIAALTYNLKTNIILDQMHLNNSYLTAKHYLNNGVKGIVLTNDITLNDINEISKQNKDSLLFKQIFGFAHLSTSKRDLVTNYLKHFNLESKSKYHIIKEENKEDFYYVYEDYFGTHILNGNPINLLKYVDDINVSYFIFDSFLIDNATYALDKFIAQDINCHDEIDKIYNSNDGFINKKTIYKVKNNE